MTLAKAQENYLKKLQALFKFHQDNGTDTFELEEEMEPFLKRRRIDLSDFYNAHATIDGWNKEHGKKLRHVARDYHSKKGIKYDIGGILQLDSGTYSSKYSDRMEGKKVSEYYDREWPPEVTGIPVHQKARLIYVVGATIWGRADTGTTVAHVILHYEGGGRAKLRLKENINLANWHDPEGIPKASLLWRGGDDNGVYEIELENPKPDKTILTIDFESAEEASAPFFLAVTLSY